MSSAGKEMGMVQRRRQISTARAVVVAAALAVLRVADGFRYAAAPLDRGAAALSRDDHCEHGLASTTTRKSRSRLMMMATDDPELPEIIEGGSGSGEKSRFMPVSFDRVETPVAVAKGAGIATTAVASSVLAGKMPATTAGGKTPRVAQQGQGQKKEQFIQPEEVPTTFEPHAAQLMPDGGNTPCSIKVVGVGGGGGNAVNRMVQTGIAGVEFWSLNTDAQALSRNLAPGKLAIGQSVTRGLGAGGVPSVGRKAAEESMDDLRLVVQGADMVFVTCGMGGGTGSGAAPYVAEAARDQGCLTVGVVTKPFAFEGRKRMSQANEGIELLREKVDTLIVIANDKLLQIVPEDTPVQDAFLVADDILRQGVVGISEIIIKPGLVNVDFADVRSVMNKAGTALMGLGKAKGKNRAAEAARAAIESPLLDFPVTDAKGIVFNIIGDADLTLAEINEAASVIYANVDPDANIIFGALVDADVARCLAVGDRLFVHSELRQGATGVQPNQAGKSATAAAVSRHRPGKQKLVPKRSGMGPSRLPATRRVSIHSGIT
ncbi:conserved unknown protein [Ectocarpus siliculosus]|uniref:Plastid division protein FtsZ n=1 Tax=Ectocarpus siliculosus TaxID=2880 RepID=D8LC51_ECTSI|nr:conserved unknown protein [Ectocarpus siliculosus]|eukprot:CBN79234.1 conserved unknown protein [Ectocarpus siliculosus]